MTIAIFSAHLMHSETLNMQIDTPYFSENINRQSLLLSTCYKKVPTYQKM